MTEIMGFAGPVGAPAPARSWWQRKRYLAVAASLAAASLVAALAWHSSSGSPHQEAATTPFPPAAAASHVPQAAGPSPTSQALDATPTTASGFANAITRAIAQERSASYTHDLVIPQGGGRSDSAGRLLYTSGGSTDYDTTVTFPDSTGVMSRDAHVVVVGNEVHVSGPGPVSVTDVGPSAVLTGADEVAVAARDARWVSSPYNFAELLDNAVTFGMARPAPGVLALHGSTPIPALTTGPTGGLFQELAVAPRADFTMTLDDGTYLPTRLEMTFVAPDLGSADAATCTATYASWGDDQDPISPPT